jgi:hypothetical protein
MSVFPILNVSEISRCVVDSLAQSDDATDIRLAKLIRRTHQYTPLDRQASLALVTTDWEERVSAAALQCRDRFPAGISGD